MNLAVCIRTDSAHKSVHFRHLYAHSDYLFLLGVNNHCMWFTVRARRSPGVKWTTKRTCTVSDRFFIPEGKPCTHIVAVLLRWQNKLGMCSETCSFLCVSFFCFSTFFHFLSTSFKMLLLCSRVSWRGFWSTLLWAGWLIWIILHFSVKKFIRKYTLSTLVPFIPTVKIGAFFFIVRK